MISIDFYKNKEIYIFECTFPCMNPSKTFPKKKKREKKKKKKEKEGKMMIIKNFLSDSLYM